MPDLNLLLEPVLRGGAKAAQGITGQALAAGVGKKKPDIGARSARLTAAMPAMRMTIEAFKQAGVRCDIKVLAGGAPIPQKFSHDIGADGCSDGATGGLRGERHFLAAFRRNARL